MKEKFQYSKHIAQDLHLANLSRDNALFCIQIKKTLDNLLQKQNELDTLEGKGYKKNHKRVCKKDYQEEKEILENRQSIVLAVSAGVDSMAMLGIFIALQKKYPRSLHIAHFNHGIREESVVEARLVQEVCQYFSLPFFTKTENIPLYATENSLGLEEASRIRRYAFLEEVRQKTHSEIICVAHHVNDLAEDTFMRLCRGTGWPALAGMQAYCDTRKLARPLLYVKKDYLMQFLKDIKFPFMEDRSNDCQDFFRNRVRSQIIPFFLQENPQFLENIKNLHQIATLDTEFFQEYMKNFWHCVERVKSSTSEQIIIPISELQKVNEAMRFRIYKKALALFDMIFSSQKTLHDLDKAVLTNHGNTIFMFTKKIRSCIKNGKLIFLLSL